MAICYSSNRKLAHSLCGSHILKFRILEVGGHLSPLGIWSPGATNFPPSLALLSLALRPERIPFADRLVGEAASPLHAPILWISPWAGTPVLWPGWAPFSPKYQSLCPALEPMELFLGVPDTHL